MQNLATVYSALNFRGHTKKSSNETLKCHVVRLIKLRASDVIFPNPGFTVVFPEFCASSSKLSFFSEEGAAVGSAVLKRVLSSAM